MDQISTIIEKNKDSRGGLIATLQDIQASEGYLSAASIETVALMTGIPLADVYGVATFYRAFSLKPRGKHLITVCLGTACHVREAPGIVDEFERQLRVRRSETTDDREFTLETVNCLGACALGPIAVVDGRYYSQVSVAQVRSIINETRNNSNACNRNVNDIDITGNALSLTGSAHGNGT